MHIKFLGQSTDTGISLHDAKVAEREVEIIRGPYPQMLGRFMRHNPEKALQIANDISEGIDNKDSKHTRAMKSIQIQITPEILERAESRCNSCPIALAVKALGYEEVSVYSRALVIGEIRLPATEDHHKFVLEYDAAPETEQKDPKFLRTLTVNVPYELPQTPV